MMLDQNKIAQLSGFALFQGINELGLLAIANVARYTHLDKGDQITNMVTNYPALTLIVNGELKVIQLTSSGREQPLYFLRAGDVEGEEEVLTQNMMDTSLIATKDSTILRIARDDLVVLLDVYPQLSRQLSMNMAYKLIRLSKQRAWLLAETVEERLWNYLLDLAQELGKNSFVLPISKKDLAAYLGTVPETLSRRLAALEQQGRLRRGNRGQIDLLI